MFHLHIQNIISIFAAVKPKTVLQILRIELFLCSFVSEYLQRYKAIKSYLDAHTCMLYRSLARQEAIAFLILNFLYLRLSNAKDQRNLHAREVQYLASNAIGCDKCRHYPRVSFRNPERISLYHTPAYQTTPSRSPICPSHAHRHYHLSDSSRHHPAANPPKSRASIPQAPLSTQRPLRTRMPSERRCSMSEELQKKYVPAQIKVTFYVHAGGAVTGPYVVFPTNREGEPLELETAAYQRMTKQADELILFWKEFSKRPKTKKQTNKTTQS